MLRAVIFDLDGVVTKTAIVHFYAWKAVFEEYLRLREKEGRGPFREFTHEKDYLPYVDGKPRYEGVKSFLESRNIRLPFGSPSDPPDKETVCGIGNRKNIQFRKVLQEKGVEVYPSTVEFIRKLKEKGIKIGVASSSKNCRYILQAAGIEDLFETRVDGVVSVELGLKGKPEGDIFVRAAFNLGVLPKNAVVVEDAASGVEAGRNGGFGLVLGVARKGNEDSLFKHYADVVVRDLADIDIAWIENWFLKEPADFFEYWQKTPGSISIYGREVSLSERVKVNPAYFKRTSEVFSSSAKPVFFLDYDGTLTPIVSRPELAVLSSEMKDILKHLCKKYPVAIVSGRARPDVENLAGIEGIFYAGSHGFDIKGPEVSLIHPDAEKIIPLIRQVVSEVNPAVSGIEGVIIEEKQFSLAVHYRLVKNPEDFSRIKTAVETAVAGKKELRLMQGKKVYEILPNVDWNKGKAVCWIMQALNLSWDNDLIVYIGDDTTDEDAFRIVRCRGVGILVAEEIRPSCADFWVRSPDEIGKIFKAVLNNNNG